MGYYRVNEGPGEAASVLAVATSAKEPADSVPYGEPCADAAGWTAKRRKMKPLDWIAVRLEAEAETLVNKVIAQVQAGHGVPPPGSSTASTASRKSGLRSPIRSRTSPPRR
jgi:hypothetical protein